MSGVCALYCCTSSSISLIGPYKWVYGGEGGSRTLARVAPPKALAKPPLQPLGYFSTPIAAAIRN